MLEVTSDHLATTTPVKIRVKTPTVALAISKVYMSFKGTGPAAMTQVPVDRQTNPEPVRGEGCSTLHCQRGIRARGRINASTLLVSQVLGRCLTMAPAEYKHVICSAGGGADIAVTTASQRDISRGGRAAKSRVKGGVNVNIEVVGTRTVVMRQSR